MNFSKDISIIVAIAENNAIGNKNHLLCHLPDDLKMFKSLTQGHTVVMGRNTWHSLPFKPLPRRRNIVISDIPDEIYEGALKVRSIDEAIESMNAGEETFIMGGAMVYRQFLPLANKLYITRIHHTFEADTWFPEIDSSIWELRESTLHEADDKHLYPFTFETYKRIS